MKITYLGTASVLLEYAGLRIITDPVLDPSGREYFMGPGYLPKKWFASKREYASPLSVKELGKLDVALVSHDHHSDNLDEGGRALLSGIPKVVTNPHAARRLTTSGLSATGLKPGESVTIGAVTVTGVTAQHGPRLVPETTQVTGFLLSAIGEPTVWISGDTVMSGALRRALPGLGAEVAIIHCGGVKFAGAPAVLSSLKFTWDAVGVAEAIGLLKPRVVVPVHRSGWTHFEPEAPLRAALDDERTRWLELGESITA